MFSALNQLCTATAPEPIKNFTMMAKTTPYPPCTPAAHYARAGRGVIAFWLKYLDPARMLRRVTKPPHIAGPLALTQRLLHKFKILLFLLII